MAQYICLNCKHNNNGWCNERKMNGLKKLNIYTCESFKSKEYAYSSTTNTDSLPKYEKQNIIAANNTMKKLEEEELLAIGNKLGQREMLFNIQRQALANNGIVDLKVLSTLSSILEGSERIFDVEKYSMEVDNMIRESSITIARGIYNV